MDSLYFEAYRFYKKQYAPSLVLFHIGSQFEAYEDDATRLSEILNIPISLRGPLKCCCFPDHTINEVLSCFIQIPAPVHIIEYRNLYGAFGIPKVKQILQDLEDDY